MRTGSLRIPLVNPEARPGGLRAPVVDGNPVDTVAVVTTMAQTLVLSRRAERKMNRVTRKHMIVSTRAIVLPYP